MHHRKVESTTSIKKRNIYCAKNWHIRMISEGSCDTGDWSKDAGNSALHHRNKLFFLNIKIKNSYFKF